MKLHLMLLFLLSVAVGCAKSTAPARYDAAPPPEMAADMPMMDDAYGGEAEMAPSARGIDTTGRKQLTSRPPPAEVRPTGSSAPVSTVPDRMVHYEGWARMRVTKPAEVLDQIAAAAVEAGGRVDRLSARDVTVRVPVTAFKATWEAVLALGDVLDKAVRADDITEQFLAVDLRVRTLKTMRDRLVRLLGRAQSDEEKLALLQQITRVTEELDATESRLRTLRDLASMSTIRVEAVPREAFAGTTNRGELDGFEWIGSLSPFNHSTWMSDKRIALTAPEEMVALSPRGPYIAESADGTVLWTLRVHNDPMGSGEFWSGAILERIGDEFEDAAQTAIGDWSCLILHEPGADEPYRWDVCVVDQGRYLHVAQAFYPSPSHVERYAEGVAKSLGGAGGDS